MKFTSIAFASLAIFVVAAQADMVRQRSVAVPFGSSSASVSKRFVEAQAKRDEDCHDEDKKKGSHKKSGEDKTSGDDVMPANTTSSTGGEGNSMPSDTNSMPTDTNSMPANTTSSGTDTKPTDNTNSMPTDNTNSMPTNTTSSGSNTMPTDNTNSMPANTPSSTDSYSPNCDKPHNGTTHTNGCPPPPNPPCDDCNPPNPNPPCDDCNPPSPNPPCDHCDVPDHCNTSDSSCCYDAQGHLAYPKPGCPGEVHPQGDKGFSCKVEGSHNALNLDLLNCANVCVLSEGCQPQTCEVHHDGNVINIAAANCANINVLSSISKIVPLPLP